MAGPPGAIWPGWCGRCHTCLDRSESARERIFRRMILCVTCRNKRCPKATDHELMCTNSNEPGQAGSIYEVFPKRSKT
jgi:hypothetical protein